jgi:hypothetical protein
MVLAKHFAGYLLTILKRPRFNHAPLLAWQMERIFFVYLVLAVHVAPLGIQLFNLNSIRALAPVI